MKPRITYRVINNNLTVVINIKGLTGGNFQTGLTVEDPLLFDRKKQICGNPEVQKFMNETRRGLEKLYRPGMTPASLWTDYTKKLVDEQVHTIKDAFDYYLITKTISNSTRENYRGIQAKVEKAGLLDTPLNTITPAFIAEFLNTLRTGEKPLQESSVYLVYIVVKTIIVTYVKAHNMPVLNLDDIMRPPKPKRTVEGQEEYLTFAEVQNLLSLDLSGRPVFEKVRDYLGVVCFTGLSLADLQRFDPATWISRDRKWIVYRRKKSGGLCEIPLLPKTEELINKCSWPCKLSSRIIQKYCEKEISTMIGRRFTPHGARKTWGCIALEFGFSMESTSRMLGHSSIITTERIYAKVTKQKIQRELNELPAGIKQLMQIPA